RAAKRIAIGAAAVVPLGAAAGAWLAGTESGLRAARRIGPGFVPGGVEIGAAAGRRAGPRGLPHRGYVRPDLRAHGQRSERASPPGALLRRTFSADRLHASGIDVVRLPGGSEPEQEEPFRMPESLSTPIAIDVALAAVDDIRVR